MTNLAGQVALITGAAQGIGRATAAKLATQGALMVVNDKDEAALAETVTMIKAAGGNAVAVPGDITAPEFADRFAQTAVDQFGGIEIVINNAGWIWDGVIQSMSDEQFHAIQAVHLEAPFRISRAVIRHIRPWAKAEAEIGAPRPRRMISVTSTSGLWGAAGQANYASAKAGLIGLTKALSREWGRYGITVNCVAFGMVETEAVKALITSGGMPEDYLAQLLAQVPLGRFAQPEDAANAIYMLCLPEAGFISGEVIKCTGGALE